MFSDWRSPDAAAGEDLFSSHPAFQYLHWSMSDTFRHHTFSLLLCQELPHTDLIIGSVHPWSWGCDFCTDCVHESGSWYVCLSHAAYLLLRRIFHRSAEYPSIAHSPCHTRPSPTHADVLFHGSPHSTLWQVACFLQHLPVLIHYHQTLPAKLFPHSILFSVSVHACGQILPVPSASALPILLLPALSFPYVYDSKMPYLPPFCILYTDLLTILLFPISDHLIDTIIIFRQLSITRRKTHLFDLSHFYSDRTAFFTFFVPIFDRDQSIR